MAKVGRKQFDGKDYNSVIQKLEQAWALDCSDEEAAAYADISKAALCEFLKRNPEISERKARLKKRPVLAARSVVVKTIQAGDAKLAMQYLERKLSSEFSTLQQVKSDVHLETSDPETENLKNDIAGINAAIAREIAEIEKLQKKVSGKRGKP